MGPARFQETLCRLAIFERFVPAGLAAGATQDEVADVLLAIAPVTGPSQLTIR